MYWPDDWRIKSGGKMAMGRKEGTGEVKRQWGCKKVPGGKNEMGMYKKVPER